MISGKPSTKVVQFPEDLIVAFEAHRAKQYHLGLGRKPIAKTTFASANQNRDYRIFEDFAFYMMEQARKKRVTDIFKLKGNVYAFDSTTIPLCLSIFWWAKFRKKKGGIKAHVLYDLESQVPAFFHISTASVYDSKAMKEIPYESGSYYVFDRGYNAFKELFKIHQHESFFVVRAKKNLQYKCCKWRRRLPKNILTDAVIEFTEYNSYRKYPEKLCLVKFYDEEQGREFAFLTNAFHLTAPEIANFSTEKPEPNRSIVVNNEKWYQTKSVSKAPDGTIISTTDFVLTEFGETKKQTTYTYNDGVVTEG